jgi:Protein of unknown function (DUF3363)
VDWTFHCTRPPSALSIDGTGRERVALAVRSDLPIDAQVHAVGATWLDRRFVGRGPAPLGLGAFGQEVRVAMDGRIGHLVGQRLAKRQGQRVMFARDPLDTLLRRELEEAAVRISESAGQLYQPATEGGPVAGTYRQRLDLASGRFAMIDDGLGFTLVPWPPSLERHLGRQISAIMRDNRIDWSFARHRSPTIG